MYELATILLRYDQELTAFYAYREQRKSRLATAPPATSEQNLNVTKQLQ